MRLQLALNVRDIDEAVDYYSKLFDEQPHKRKPGYANFAIAQPPLKLVLFQNPDAMERINHLGVEVGDSKAIPSIAKRLSSTGIIDRTEEQTNCCFAVQNKVWSLEPQGIPWEWYSITDDDPEETTGDIPEACCT